MRKFLRYFFVLIALIVAAIVLIPIIFQDEIFEMVRTESKNHIKGEVAIGDMSLSLFSDFPNLTLSVQDVSITGEDVFEGMKLIDAGEISVEIDLFSAFGGDNISIESIRIANSDLYVLVMPDGMANYDIMKESAEVEEEETPTEESAPYSLSLKDFSLDHVNLVYDDRQGGMYVNIKDLVHDLSGDFSADVVDMSTHTEIEEMTVSLGSTDYLRRTNVEAEMDMKYTTSAQKIELGDNSIRLNGMKLNATGDVVMGDVMQLDLKLNAPSTEFAEVLSLIPEVYYNDFDDIETSGSFAFDAFVKGTMDETESLPAFGLNLKVSDASFKYPDVPAGAENLNVEVHVNKPQGTADATVVDIPNLSGLLAGQPVEAKLKVDHPISNPNIDMYAKANLDLGKVAAMVPQEGLSYSGKLFTDIAVKGKMSDFEAQNVNAVEAKGNVQLSKFKAQTTSFGLPFELDTMNMNWRPQSVSVSALSGKLGESNFSGTGTLDNIMSYVMSDTTLRGRFNLTSTLLNLDELAAAAPQGEAATEEESTESTGAVRIPTNLDMDLSTKIDRVLYDGMTIEDLRGKVILVDGVAALEGVTMKTLDGTIGMNGSYDSRQLQPEVLFDMSLSSLDIGKAIQYLDMFKAYAPIAESAVGKLNSNFSLNAFLGSDMTPDLNTLNASGLLRTIGVKVEPDVMQKLGTMLNNESYSRLLIGGSEIDFAIENGRLSVQPFDVTIGGKKATVSGSSGLDQSIDYTMTTKLPINGIKVPQEVAALGLTGDIDVNIRFTGTATQPKVSTNFGDITSGIQTQVQNAIQDEINNQRDNAINAVNEEAEKIMEQARAEAQKVKDEAKVQADRIRSEARSAAQRLRDEAKKQGDELIARAGSNPIAKAAAERGARELREEADEKANKLISEADTRANRLESEAATRADEIIAKAEERAKIEN
ncbi:MAG: hypothetical protein HWE14_10840 [Flavobacteriia bacterium]|nr:hypothetical protein [Flavobacteriia bacterium]